MSPSDLFSTTAAHDPGPSTSGEPSGRERRSIRGRRSSITPNQRIALAALGIVGVVIGILTEGAPTGNAPVDAIYRCAFVVGVLLAASRARRWSLFVAALPAALFGDGTGRIVGPAALLIAFVAAGRGVRDRVVGAVCGVAIATGLLHLELDLFTGAPTLLATVAVAPLLWSGYGNSRSATRRIVRRCALAIAAVLLVGTVVLGVQGAIAAKRLTSAVDAANDVIRNAQNGDSEATTVALALAREAFRDASSIANAAWALPGRLVPIGAQHAAVIDTVADTGESLTATAGELAASVDYEGLRSPDGTLDLDAVRTAAPIARRAAAELNTTDTRLDDIDDTWLLPMLTDRLAEYRERVDGYAAQTTLAATALEVAPGMLGAEGPRHYLILLGNPAELRDLGGHIGNWAVLSANAGRLTLDAVGVPMDLSNPQLDRAVADDPAIPPSLLVLQPARYPQNWGGVVDLNVAARLSSRLYTAKTGTPIDGVVYADPFAFAALLEITGPVNVAGVGPLAADNAVRFLTRDQFVDPAVPSEALTDAISTAFDEFSNSPLPSPRRLGDLFAPLVRQGRLRMVSLHEADRPLLAITGLSDTFTIPETGDFLTVVNRNANPSKLDAYLSKTVAYAADWNPDDGSVDATVTVRLTNDATDPSLSDLVVGAASGLPRGDNLTDVAVITPLRAVSATLDGAPISLSSEREGRGWRHTAHLQLPAGSTATLELVLEGAIGRSERYTLLYGAQPILGTSEAEFSVRSGGRELLDDEASGARFSGTGLAFVATTAE